MEAVNDALKSIACARNHIAHWVHVDLQSLNKDMTIALRYLDEAIEKLAGSSSS